MQPIWAVGLMTGTVLDGNIDVALIRTDGERVDEFGPFMLHPYPDEINELLRGAVAAAQEWNFTGAEPDIFATAADALTRAQADAVVKLIEEAGLKMTDIAVVGFHGQTVLHRPPLPGRRGETCQLGDGALMARLLGIDVAYDFRSADMRAGGQGAPLSALYHQALLAGAQRGSETAVLNLGGVANLTWVAPNGDLIAFDTGPANGPINDWVAAHGRGVMDVDGMLARAGEVDEALLASLLAHPFLCAPFPKSLDRFDFTMDMARGKSVEDGAALLTAFVAGGVKHALDLLAMRPRNLIVCGGGRRNPAILAALAERAGVIVELAEQLGWRGDAIEAECFALLGVRVLRGLPISFPTTTGVPEPMAGGRLASALVL